MKRKLMLLMACITMCIGLVNAQTQKVTGTVISDEEFEKEENDCEQK